MEAERVQTADCVVQQTELMWEEPAEAEQEGLGARVGAEDNLFFVRSSRSQR